jgi:hypothetical protein
VRKPWTTERKDALRMLWDNNLLSGSVIADRLNADFPLLPRLSKSAVIGAVHRMKLPHRTVAAPRKPRSDIPKPPPAPAIHKPVALKPRPVASEPFFVRGCCWPVGEKPLEPDYFCNRPIERGSYCAEHAARAYIPTRHNREAELFVLRTRTSRW